MTARDRIHDAITALQAAIIELDEDENTQEIVVPPADAAPPRWLTIARAEMGQREVRGEGAHNPRILEYLATTSLGRWGRSRDETAWCSAFANWCMQRAGLEGTGSAMARSWLGWGIDLQEPRAGCIVVLARGAPPAGHVGFYLQRDGEMVRVLGGNQANAVSVQPYPRARVLGYRWPAES